MVRARTLFVLTPLLLLLACDAPPTAPVVNSEPGLADSINASGNGLRASFGPFPITYPFMPYPDGYQFRNYGGAGDWELYADIFGGHVHLWSLADMAYFNDTFVPAYGNGVCYGFAVTAGMFYRDVFGPHQSLFQRGATDTWEITQATRGGGGLALDEGIERHISKYYFFQVSPQIWRQRIRKSPAGGERLVEAVEAAQEAGWEDPWVLGFTGPWGGHAVNILNVERTETGATFTVWDNNAPFSETNNPGFRKFHWSPDEFTYGTREIARASVRAVSPHERDHVDKWWGAPRFSDFYVLVSRVLDPGVLVVHTDVFGQRLGRTSAAVFDEIPGGEEVTLLTGVLNDDWQAPVLYHLPLGDYTVDLLSPETGNLAYQLFAGDAMFSVETSGTGPSTGRVSNFLEERTFAFETRDPIEGLRARLVRVLSDEEERALTISGLPLPADGLLRITPSADASRFNVVLEGDEVAPCDLSLIEITPAGAISQTLPAVKLFEGASLSVEPWDWSRLTEMPIFVRTLMPDASVFLRAYNATAMNLDELLDDMAASGAIPTRGIATSIRKQVERAPDDALINHLESLVAEGKIARETADLILATAEAAKE